MNEHVVLTDHPIDLAALQRVVRRNEHGAVVTFLGVTRETSNGDPRPVEALQYEAYPVMALAQMREIVAETKARWPGAEIAIVHRTGTVALGDPSVAVAVGAPHRAEAFDACEYAIDALKARVEIWKRERYADGADAWVANRFDGAPPPAARPPC